MRNSIIAALLSILGVLMALNAYITEVKSNSYKCKIWWLFISSIFICNLIAWIIIIKWDVKFDAFFLTKKYFISVITSACLYLILGFSYTPIASLLGLQYEPFYDYVFSFCRYIIVAILIIMVLNKLTNDLIDTITLFLTHPIPHLCIFIFCFTQTFSIAM